MTHAQQIRLENKQIKDKVEALLGWDNETYCRFQEEIGYRYLECENVIDPNAIKELTYMKEFWNWWKMQFIKRDKIFLHDIEIVNSMFEEGVYSADNNQYIYKKYHTPNAILFTPHKTLLRDSYARFIGKINKQIVNG